MEKTMTMLIEPQNVFGIAPVRVMPYETEGDNLRFFYKHIECELVDIVPAYALKDHPDLKGVCLVVDDEGLCKEGAQVNALASLLYGYMEHGQPLVGKVLVCKDVETPRGVETGGLTMREVQMLQEAIGKLAGQFNKRVAKGGDD